MAKENTVTYVDATRQESPEQGADFSFMQKATERMESLMRWQLDLEEEVERIKKELKGYEWDVKNREYVRNEKRPKMMTDEGVDSVMGKFKTAVANKNTPFGNIDENKARNIAKDLHYSICGLMYENQVPWKLNISEYSPFSRSLSIFTYLLLTRPIDEGERQFLQPILKYLEDARAKKEGERRGFSLTGR